MATSKKLTASAFVSFGDYASDVVARVVFQVIDTAALLFSAVPQGRVRGLPDAELADLPYINRADPGVEIAAGTPITAPGIYEIDTTGIETGLDNTYTSGDGRVEFTVVAG